MTSGKVQEIPTQEYVCSWLVANGLLSESDLDRAQRMQVSEQDLRNGNLAMLQRMGVIKEASVALAYSTLLNVPVLEDAGLTDASAALKSDYTPAVSERFMRFHGVAPFIETADLVQVAVSAPLNAYAIEALHYSFEKALALQIATPTQLTSLIDRLFGEGRSAMDALIDSLDGVDESRDDIEHLRDMASEAPIIRLVNLILQRAVEHRASDIHLEPFESSLKVRYRIDGLLEDVESPPASSAAAVISRLKIMARLDIAERRLPQDGRIMLRIHGKELDLRVSTVPTSYGESVVMRLLDRDSIRFDFHSLGIDGPRLQLFLQLLDAPHGVVLVTGPTGSGKTTTLYTALSRLNTAQRKIITVEDPVEYQLEGVNQIQVKPSIGLDFPVALRSIVRQDPDVIMIGEMRDAQTCRIAIQSSLTGHLVLSTLHTNSAAASITRLLDMGVESYLIASTVKGILAQRLVRRLVPETRVAFEATASVIAQHQLDRYTQERPIMLYRPGDAAGAGGYHGRSALTELLIMNDELRTALFNRADAAALEQVARRNGLVTLYEDGLRQALNGTTTLEEVLRVTRSD